MTKRVLGVLAALSMVMGSMACGSSSSSGPTPAADTGVAKSDAKSETTITPTDSGAPLEPEADKTTGKACTTEADCDVTGNGYARCGANYYIGPLNPTKVCFRAGTAADDPPPSGDICPFDDKKITLCDGETGLCTKSATQPAMCEPMCVFDSTGAFKTTCAGKNGCSVEQFGTDAAMKVVAFGTCIGGCNADADCPTGSKCDPMTKYCMKNCTSDTTCKAGWSTAPAAWKCDVARGACAFIYAKKLGEACATEDDCFCIKRTADPGGMCGSYCRTGGTACDAGFTCDALLPEKDDMGVALWTLTTQPAGISGICLKNCTADTDCLGGHVCGTSPGQTQKTCRPPTTP